MGIRDFFYVNSCIDVFVFCFGFFCFCYVCFSLGFGNKGLGISVCLWLGLLGLEDRYCWGYWRYGFFFGYFM